MDGWELVYYETASGRCPVREFLDDLSGEQAERVVRKLDLLETLGTRLDPPHVKPLRGRIWELRVTGRVHHRVLYAAVVGRRIVLLHAFTKKSQRTPTGEIDLAEARLADYLERGGP
ncbi:MAG TPA: type II toxin-antitoxin system RelE/ParE family toxin [Thermomicrobiaceae bacterium]|nr:type II toxin-antitoxin system RelE/ParE family toxin [Thermomicrobiaceae bacterium]